MPRRSSSWLWSCSVLAVALSACWSPVNEFDCLLAKTCECEKKSDCKDGKDCIDGFCRVIPDAGMPGDYGWPCGKDSECHSGPCLPRGPGNGAVCSAVCNTGDAGTSCQRNWDCKQSLTDAGGFVCTPPLNSQCLTCKTDFDCNAAGDRCLAIDAGTFCLQDCTLKGCPAGHDCRALSTAQGVAHVCVPENDTCRCGPQDVGLTRACHNMGTLGTCYGFEACQPNGVFGGCSARVPSPEVCDGIDDDCDGLTDDADPKMDHSQIANYPDCTNGTTCKGKVYCGPTDAGSPDASVPYAFLCSAPPAITELCNGIDDDCDGLIDEDFKDSTGVFSGPRACGSCSLDCTQFVPNLLRNDAGVLPTSVDCVQTAGTFRCVPRACDPGYFAWPPGAPEVCQRATTSECRTCAGDSDCGVPGDICTTVSNDVGTYCLQSCEASSPYAGCSGATGVQSCCPGGSTCEMVNGKRFCEPAGNACSCNASRVGFTRSCLKTTGPAVCIGQQVCRADGGFDACDSSLTALELCDGLDNDCDGKIDQPFMNTQGSGTYDTDQHCGSCTTNCQAQWSPTIQHAVGGCRLAPGPTCQIIQCTSGSIPGGKFCDRDQDCGSGTCDSLYHQCSCSGGVLCGASEVCNAGFCTQSCSGDATCSATYGATSHCGDAGVCVVPYTFVNADNDSTNGCECPAASGVVDVPEIFAAYPPAGAAYPDRDCDGIDGREKRSLFVWAQSLQSKGTRTQPYRTLAEAISAFDATQFDTILVAQGSYAEQLVLKNGVQIFGGYSSDFKKRDIVTFPTLIEAPEPDFTKAFKRGTVNAENLSSNTVVAGFTIRGYDVTTRLVQAPSSFAVYVKNSPGLQLVNNHIFGGRGGDGPLSAFGTSGANGGPGGRGLDSRECTTMHCTGEQQDGGLGGVNASCAGAGGFVGAFSTLSNDPQQYQTGGLNGSGGANAIYQQSNPSQAMFCKYDCVIPNGPLNGGPATNGGDGSAGAGGMGCAAARGSLSGDDWSGAIGRGGSSGSNAIGGGGGGAGGCVDNQNPSTCTVGHRVGDLGATGGGGGAGGCGGTAGAGGTAGGGSFGVFIVGAPPKVQGNIVEPGFGGAGGPGGAGGYGGIGGPGGEGGLITTIAWCGGQGGPGGRGGNGGGGGGGGGGCGGVSFGIAGAAIAGQAYDMSNTIVSPPINAAGSAGVGGASPGGSAGKGSDGIGGATGTVGSF